MSRAKLTGEERNYLSFYWHNYLDDFIYNEYNGELFPDSEIHKMMQVFGKELASEGKFDVDPPIEPCLLPWADTDDLRRRLLELTSNDP